MWSRRGLGRRNLGVELRYHDYHPMPGHELAGIELS